MCKEAQAQRVVAKAYTSLEEQGSELSTLFMSKIALCAVIAKVLTGWDALDCTIVRDRYGL